MKDAERIEAMIQGQKPDRVPVIPTLLPEPAAGLAGLTGAQIANDNRTAVDAMMKVFDEYGGWDNPYPGGYTPVQLQTMGVFPMKMKIPGVDLEDDYMFQLLEQEMMKPEDYEKICEMGCERFYYEERVFLDLEMGQDSSARDRLRWRVHQPTPVMRRPRKEP